VFASTALHSLSARQEAAMAELQSQYQQAQQPTQQQSSNSYGSWPFNFFGW
jgi:hypothetical protein